MKAHRTDAISLAFALIFLAMAGWWLLAQIVELALPAVGWFLAGALILIGVLGLFGALRSGRSTPPAGAGPAVDPGVGPLARTADSGDESGQTVVLTPVSEDGPSTSGYGTGWQQPHRFGDEPSAARLGPVEDDGDARPVTEPTRAGESGPVPGGADRSGPA